MKLPRVHREYHALNRTYGNVDICLKKKQPEIIFIRYIADTFYLDIKRIDTEKTSTPGMDGIIAGRTYSKNDYGFASYSFRRRNPRNR